MTTAAEAPRARAGHRPFTGRKRWFWLVVPVVTLAALGALMIPRPNSVAQTLVGTHLQGRIAPNFRLKDQFGKTIQLSQFRGHLVVLTTMEASCTELCPVVAETIRRSLAEIGPESPQIQVLALSMDPTGDTPSAVQTFSRQHGMLYRWHYLTGSRSVLSRIWAAYYIWAAPPSSPPSVRDSHTSATFLIDSQGHERILMTGGLQTGDMVRDLRILSGESAGGAVALVPAPEVGHPAPDFTLPSLQGSSLQLSSLRGKDVLVNFWASWCKPCRSEMPMLAGWQRRLQSQGLLILGIDKQEKSSDVKSFTQQLHIPYRIALDGDGSVSDWYNVIGLPTTLLIDRHGTVRWVKAGVLSPRDLSSVVEPLLHG